MARFYGWSDLQMMSMTNKEFLEYYKAIDVISARESLDMIRNVQYPHVSKQDQNNVKQNLNKRSRNISNAGKTNLSNSQMAEIMARRMRELNNGR